MPGSRGVSGGPAQGGDGGATMETQCPRIRLWDTLELAG